jgi:hypothetical protein
LRSQHTASSHFAVAACGAFLCALLLAGCADSETRSIVSKTDLLPNGYHKILVFVEDSDPTPHSGQTPSINVANGQITLFIPEGGQSGSAAEIEQKLLSSLGSAGVAASGGSTFFKEQKLTEQAKATEVQKVFDAVLYVTILVNGMREQMVAGASQDGQFISIYGETRPIDDYDKMKYTFKEDGTVYQNVPTLQTKSDLQDTKTNKQVWSAETIGTGGTLVLASSVSDQIVKSLHENGAI